MLWLMLLLESSAVLAVSYSKTNLSQVKQET